MCSDDLERAYYGPTNYYAGGGFGVDVAAMLADPGNTYVQVSELVVHPPAAPTVPVAVTPVVVSGIEIVQGVAFPAITNVVLSAPIMIPDDTTMPPNPTPNVVARPAGVDFNLLNGMAAFRAVWVWGNSVDTGWEHGIAIFKKPDGSLGITNVATSQQFGSISGAKIYMPPGSKIVGWIHSHPYTPGVDQRMPSPASQGPGSDGAFIADMISKGVADPNVVTYIVTSPTGNTNYDPYNVYAYDVNNVNSLTVGDIVY